MRKKVTSKRHEREHGVGIEVVERTETGIESTDRDDMFDEVRCSSRDCVLNIDSEMCLI